MKQVALCLFLLLLSVGSNAQRNKYVQLPKGCFEVTSGLAIPLNEYALTDLSDPAGYAGNGISFSAALSYDAFPFLGVSFRYQHINNPVLDRDYEQDLINATISSPILQFKKFTSNPHRLNVVQLGLYYPFVSDRLSFDIGGAVNVLGGTLPESIADVYLVSNNINLRLKQIENTSSGFGYSGFLRFRYCAYKQLLLIGSVSYTAGEVEYSDIRFTDISGNTVGLAIVTDDYKQKYDLIVISAGIGYAFH